MLHKITLTILLFIISLPARSFELPADFKAEYKLIKMDTLIGKTTLRLNRNKDQISYTVSSEPKGIIALVMRDKIEETSTLHFSAGKEPRLTHYSYFKNKIHEKNQDISITWQDNLNAKIRARYKNKTHILNHTGPLWDRNSMQIALMAALKADLNITSLDYNVVDKGEIDSYQYRHIANEPHDLGKKRYNTLKFSLQQPGSNRITYLWLAPELDYLPVYVEQHKDNTLNLTMELVKHEASKS